MSPPIYTPDGSEVSKIVLPDGSTASEVIGPDGNVVFEAGPDIPDSVIWQVPMSEGSGTVASDAVGDADLNLTDVGWNDTTDSWFETFATVYDGSTSYGEVPSADVTNTGDSGTLLITARPRSFANNGYLFHHRDATTDTRLYLRHESGNGELRAGVAADPPLTGFTLNTDTTNRFALRWDSGSYAVFVDGSSVDAGTYAGTVTTSASAWYTSAREIGAGIDERFDGFLDNPQLADEPLTDSQITADYDRQPWS